MSDLALKASDTAKLRALALVLIPGTATMPAIGALPSFDALLVTAVKACGYPDALLRQALDALPADVDWAGAKNFHAAERELFEPLSVLVSAAYYMAPEVLAMLKFPTDRRHPAGSEEFLEEYETGMLDPVVERGPRYRETERSGG